MNIEVIQEEVTHMELEEILKSHKKTIIFCHFKQTVEILTVQLGEDLVIFPYIGPDQTKAKIQLDFEEASEGVLISTKAQAFGVSYTNITQVVVWEVPDGIELLYQMLGRASREGVYGDVKIMYSRKTVQFHEKHTHKSLRSGAINQTTYDILQKSITALKNFAESSSCRWKSFLVYFKENEGESFECATNCDNCRGGKSETYNVTEFGLPILRFFLPDYSATLTDIRYMMSGRKSEISKVDMIAKEVGEKCGLLNLCKASGISFHSASKMLDGLILDGFLEWSHTVLQGQCGTRLRITDKGRAAVLQGKIMSSGHMRRPGNDDPHQHERKFNYRQRLNSFTYN